MTAMLLYAVISVSFICNVCAHFLVLLAQHH